MAVLRVSGPWKSFTRSLSRVRVFFMYVFMKSLSLSLGYSCTYSQLIPAHARALTHARTHVHTCTRVHTHSFAHTSLLPRETSLGFLTSERINVIANCLFGGFRAYLVSIPVTSETFVDAIGSLCLFTVIRYSFSYPD